MGKDILLCDEKQRAYNMAVETWVVSIREEEALASSDHTIAEVDAWEAAHFREEEFRTLAKKAKKEYEDDIRKEFFGF